jgi:hypothetical protein
VKWILDDNGTPRREPDLFKWADWFENADNRVVKLDYYGIYKISTVFLGVNYNFEDPCGVNPILWETMVFGGPLDNYMKRCGGNKEQAEAMHEEVLQYVKEFDLSGVPRE